MIFTCLRIWAGLRCTNLLESSHVAGRHRNVVPRTSRVAPSNCRSKLGHHRDVRGGEAIDAVPVVVHNAKVCPLALARRQCVEHPIACAGGCPGTQASTSWNGLAYRPISTCSDVKVDVADIIGVDGKGAARLQRR